MTKKMFIHLYVVVILACAITACHRGNCTMPMLCPQCRQDLSFHKYWTEAQRRQNSPSVGGRNCCIKCYNQGPIPQRIIKRSQTGCPRSRYGARPIRMTITHGRVSWSASSGAWIPAPVRIGVTRVCYQSVFRLITSQDVPAGKTHFCGWLTSSVSGPGGLTCSRPLTWPVPGSIF